MADTFDQKVDLRTLAVILFDEVDKSGPMSAKAFHKITYSINKKLQQRGIDTDIEYFWYKFGTMTVTHGSPVTTNRVGSGHSEVVCAASPGTLDTPSELEQDIRDATRETLDTHSNVGTEGLTDRMYEDAPYEFQRQYRNLDSCIQKQIRELGDTATEFDREEIRAHLHRFIDVFPEDQFQEHCNDLYLWYDILSNLLDDSTTTLGDIEDKTELFWTIIMIDLATQPKTGVDEYVFGAELNLDDPEGLQQYLRDELRQLEDDHLRVTDQTNFLVEAADAVMASRLDFVEL